MYVLLWDWFVEAHDQRELLINAEDFVLIS